MRTHLFQTHVLILVMVGIGAWMVSRSDASWLTWLLFSESFSTSFFYRARANDCWAIPCSGPRGT